MQMIYLSPTNTVMSIHRSVENIASGVSVSASSSLDVTKKLPPLVKHLTISVRVTYDASATAGAVLNVYLSPDGTNYDTQPYYSATLAFTAGATIQESHDVDVNTPYVKIEIKNTDGTYALTASAWITYT